MALDLTDSRPFVPLDYDFSTSSLQESHTATPGEAWIPWGDRISRIQVPNGPMYYLKQEVDSVSFPAQDGWCFCVPKLSDLMYGHGDSPVTACLEWISEVHSQIQSLLTLRPFQMSDSERQQWFKFQDIIDLGKYLSETPYECRESGCITRKQGLKVFFEWRGGRKEEIDMGICRVPHVLAGIALYRPIAVLLKRERSTNAICEVLSVERVNLADSSVPDLPLHNLDDLPDANPWGEA